jgi:hypothetical protein
MKARIISTFLFLSMMFAVQSLFAQLSVNSPYPARHRGFWSLGINGGSAYQTSDVARLYQGWGAGFTLGKNVYYRPGGLFSFDFRGRFLYDESYGLDSKRSYGIKFNNSVNGTNDADVNYLKPKGNGYIFANHKTQMGEIGLEGVLTFNRFRERTGIVASVYGGVGVNLYSVYTNQNHTVAGKNENYAALYQSIDTSAGKSSIRQQLINGLDKDYESFGDANEGAQVKIMPSLGFELGYQFAPRFHASIGHRLTYSLTDNLDGQQWNNVNAATGNNDRSNYTYLKLEWELTPINACREPKIEITAPSHNPYNTEQATERVSAKIDNIKNSLDVTYKVNGEIQEFDFYNPRVSKIVNLRPGRNEVEITATNACGKDVEMVIINYTPPKPIKDEPTQGWNQPPVVVTPPSTKQESPLITVTNPSNNPYTTYENSFAINATILNVTNDNDVSFKQNGSERSFTFSPTRGAFLSNIVLLEGKNIFEIKAKNSVGVANAEVVIYYEVRVSKPSIRIVEPSNNYTETYEEIRNIRAETKFVFDKRDVRFTVNGRAVSDFAFNSYNGDISKNLSLNEGRNVVKIEVENANGRASDEINIVRKRDIITPPPPVRKQAPIVSITSPSQQRNNTYDASTTIRANIQYVDNQSDITFSVNGRRNNNFSFNRGNFTANVNLDNGNNTFTIYAQNRDGDDEKSVTIVKEERYTPPVVNRPEVTINSPKNNAKFNESTCQLEAYVKNVSGKNDLGVSVNGNRTDFNYNPMSKKITATVTLREGSNTIKVVAKNEGGSDDAQVTVTYQKPMPAPIVTIKTPSNGSTTDNSNAALNATVQHVTNKSNISVTQNGKRIDFTFNNGAILANVILAEGENTLMVAATNDSGNDNKTVKVTFKKAVVVVPPRNPRETKSEENTGETKTDTESPVVNAPGRVPRTEIATKPTINIISLSQEAGTPRNPATGKCTLLATVLNVNKKTDITVTLNGNVVDFQYNNITNEISSDFQLIKGENVVVVKATNKQGSKELKRTLTY